MAALASLYEPIAADLQRVCDLFDDELFSELPFVNELCRRIRQYRGKMLRPALVLLAGRACGGTSARHLKLAAVVELVHMSTLLHDDVLDEAEMRRRQPTINAVDGNETAVLIGDYLISHAFHLCSTLSWRPASTAIAETTNVICEGELQQIHHRGDNQLTAEQYLRIIAQKTAALTAVSCRLGALASGADAALVDALEQYGFNVGIAFQITDDVLDIVGSPERMGKTLGRDLDKHKLTLPLIQYLAQASPQARRRMLALLADNGACRAEVRDRLIADGSLNHALQCAREYVESAVACLTPLPPSEAREILTTAACLIVDRES